MGLEEHDTIHGVELSDRTLLLALALIIRIAKEIVDDLASNKGAADMVKLRLFTHSLLVIQVSVDHGLDYHLGPVPFDAIYGFDHIWVVDVYNIGSNADYATIFVVQLSDCKMIIATPDNHKAPYIRPACQIS